MAQQRIVVLDDEPEMRDLLTRILRDADFAVEAHADPEGALRSSAERPSDLALVDLGLAAAAGGGDFLEALGRLEHPPAILGVGEVPALDALLRGSAGHVAGFVARPVDARDLLSTCRRVLHAREGTTAPPSERRGSPRHALRLPLELLTSSGDPLAIGELLDLSAGGASHRVPAPFDVGERLYVAVPAEEGGEQGVVEIEGYVRWARRDEEGYLHGLEFAELPPSTARWLARICEAKGD
jgi:CheY-like chemotaxis protein